MWIVDGTRASESFFGLKDFLHSLVVFVAMYFGSKFGNGNGNSK